MLNFFEAIIKTNWILDVLDGKLLQKETLYLIFHHQWPGLLYSSSISHKMYAMTHLYTCVCARAD